MSLKFRHNVRLSKQPDKKSDVPGKRRRTFGSGYRRETLAKAETEVSAMHLSCKAQATRVRVRAQ
jgi:hypothetical protein